MQASLLTTVRQFSKTPRIRTLAALTLLLSCLIAAVGVLSYYSSKAMITREMQDPQYLILQIDRDRVEKLYAEMNDASLKVLSSLILGRRGADAYYTKIADRMQFLTDLCSNHVESIYVYDRKRAALTASLPDGYYSTPALFYDSAWIPSSELLLSNRSAGIVSRTVVRGDTQRTVITLYRKVENSRFSGLIAVNVDGDRFFSDNAFDTYTNRFVLDEQNHLLYGSSPDENRARLLEIACTVRNREPETFEMQGELFLFSALDSAMTGWRFCSYVPMDRVLSDVRILRNVIWILSVFSILAGFLVMLHTHRQMMKPVRRLGDLILQSAGLEHRPADLDTIADFTVSLIRSNNDLIQTLERDRAVLKSKFLEDLIYGKISVSEANKRWQSLLSAWEPNPVCVAILSIDDYYGWKSGYSQEDEYLFKYAVGNIADELIGEQCRSIRMNDTADRLVFLLQDIRPDTSGTGQADLHAALWQNVVEAIHRHLTVRVSIGLGGIVENCGGIKHSFRQASHALEQRLYAGYQSVLSAPSFTEHSAAPTGFLDDKLLDELRLAMESGQIPLACALLLDNQKYFETNHTPPSVVCDYLRRVLVMQEKLSPGKEDALDINAVYTMEMTAIYSRICSLLTRHSATPAPNGSQRRTELLVRQMVTFMRQHYQEDISIADVAQSSGMGISNASALFKRAFGQTIYDYLTAMRMDHACELLTTTPLTIVQVAQNVGYQNETSFRRVFKKEKHLTPGEYKQMRLF